MFQENWIVWKFVVVSLAVWAIFLMPWFQENWIVWKIVYVGYHYVLFSTRFQENWIVWKFGIPRLAQESDECAEFQENWRFNIKAHLEQRVWERCGDKNIKTSRFISIVNNQLCTSGGNMMSNNETPLLKVLGFVGVGTKETTYEINGVVIKTKFTPVAIVKAYKPKELILFLTKESKEMHLEEVVSAVKDLAPETSVRIVDIDIPADERGVWELFQTILSSVESGDRIIFDLTHAPRHITLISFLAILFLKEVKDVEIEKIFYGYYTSGPVTPVIDLTSAVVVVDWLYSTREYMNYARGENLANLMREVNKRLHLQKEIETGVIRTMGGLIDVYSKALRYGLVPIAMEKANIISEKLPEFEENLKKVREPLWPVVESLHEVTQFLGDYTGPLSIALVETIHKISEEQLKKGYPAKSLESMRENIVNLVLLIMGRHDKKYIKNWLEWDGVRATASGILNGMELEEANKEFDRPELYDVVSQEITSMGIRPGLLSLWSQTRSIRNPLAHAGMTNEQIDVRGVITSANRILERFQDILKKFKEQYPSSPSPPQSE